MAAKTMDLPGTPPHALRAAWSEVPHGYRAAVLTRLANPTVTTSFVKLVLERIGCRVPLSELERYRAGLLTARSTK
ncbi:hypothetical protein [Salininema proteolyticum]|uniref:Uncharacterized protein n=1 Tax=Salininema proteolyticum TaxID=1607685 RepID=A0ABV8TUN5_9ACTN